MPLSVAHSVAQRAAPELTVAALEANTMGRSVYGEPLQSDSGNALTLRRTGATVKQLRFVANGTIVRCALGTPYAKYLIRYGLLPNSKAAMPADWTRRLNALVHEVKP